jgi:GNAT superfamily N-acetyltransferase
MDGPVEIREARSGDGAELVRLWLDMADHLVSLDPERFRRPSVDGLAQAFDDRLANQVDDTRELVAEADHRLVGFVVVRLLEPVATADRQILRHLGDVRAEIPALGVESASRRRGVGRLLMAAAEGWARERGATSVTLDTFARSPLSNPFYRALGFEPTSIVYARRLD